MVVDELVRFYGRPAEEFLNLPISKFWLRFKNMSILNLQEMIQKLVVATSSQSKDVGNLMYRLNWQLEQLTGEEKPDDTRSWKKKYGGKKKKKKKKKRKNELLFKKFKLKDK